MSKDNRKSALLLGLAHFFVDFTCTALLTYHAQSLSFWQTMACAVLYNGFAFAFQLPVGALGDCMKLRWGFAGLGCILVALGSLVPVPMAMSAVIGIGNACFHVGGGREALKRGGRKAGIVGRFVAPGAIGIFLGPRLAKHLWLTRMVLPATLLGIGAILVLTRREGRSAGEPEMPAATMGLGRLIAVCACMFLTVLIRSYMGTVLNYPILSELGWAFGFTLCIFGGKYFGGILSDRFGTLRLCSAAQMLATVLFMLSVSFPVLALPGIFLFNTTMAVTASRLYACMPRLPGTMFGLTTFALYLGMLPRLLHFRVDWMHPMGLGALSFVSAVLLIGGLILSEGGCTYGCGDRKIADSVTCADAGN